MSDNGYKKWVCIICAWVYDEEAGAPDEGIAPGTRWEDVPEYWVCPDCGAGKDDFEMVEI
ncbi:MAG: rubredoxin [Lysobacterales bacterium]|jgi:rubredoxin|nr:rubredoxin [Xanthomonadales bacterium]